VTALALALAELEASLPDDVRLAFHRTRAGQWHATAYQWRAAGADLYLTASGHSLAAAVAALWDA
jgi:hypothetical protein